MNFEFNNDINIIYLLDYFIKKDLNNLKIYNPKNFNFSLENLYNIYINNINDKEKEKIISIGDFSNKAKYVINNDLLFLKNYNIFNDYFNNFAEKDKIKEDILSNKNLNLINMEFLESFYVKKLNGKIKIYITPFVSGAFGIKKEDYYYIILGVKYNEENKKYVSCGTLVPKIIHELTHPFVEEKMKDKNSNIDNDKLYVSCYDQNQIEELLVRVIEILISSKFLGNDYLKWALEQQDIQNFLNVRKIFNTLDKDISNIKNIDEFFDLLIEKRILIL